MGIYERKLREKENRKQEILTAAHKVFSEKGFNRATMEEIATQAELSPGALYLYFRSKEELHASLSIDMLGQLSRETQKAMNEDISFEKKIMKFGDVFIDMYDYDPNILINLFHLQAGETLLHLSDEALGQLKDFSVQAHTAIVEVLRKGIEAGVFIDENPVVLADILWASYSGVVLWVDSKRMLSENKKNFVKSTLQTTFKIIVQGLKAKQKSEKRS